ncbi:hypothetical protein ABXZ88_003207 [Vibrio fluvialis]
MGALFNSRYSNGLVIELDPSDHYKNTSEEVLMEGAGLLPHFVTNSEQPLREQLEAGYGYPVSITSGDEFTVAANGAYQYPDDPTLYPYVKMSLGDEHVFIYPYSIVTFFKGGELLGYGRMD